MISEVYQRNRNVTWFFGSMYFLDTKWIGTNWKLFNRKQKRWFLFDSWKWSIRKLFSVPTKILPFLSLVLGNRRWYFLLFESSICMGTTLVFSSSDDSSCHVSKKMSNIWSNIELNKVKEPNVNHTDFSCYNASCQNLNFFSKESI